MIQPKLISCMYYRIPNKGTFAFESQLYNIFEEPQAFPHSKNDQSRLAAAAKFCHSVVSRAAVQLLDLGHNPIRTPAYTRRALPRPLLMRCSTPWRQILNYDGASDFILSMNFPNSLMTLRILHLFETQRANLNWGCP